MASSVCYYRLKTAKPLMGCYYPIWWSCSGKSLVRIICQGLTCKRSWQDRIPFVLFVGVATSVDLFQVKLSSRATQCLQGQSFHIEHVDIESLFLALHARQSGATFNKRTTDAEERHLLRIGPQLSRAIMGRQREHVQSPSALIHALKVRYLFTLFHQNG